MKERIKEFIDYKGISAGELATSLDVQRSNISHILNGRNKPGAALIEKLLLVFPDLNARWLLTGEGNMINSVVSANVGGTTNLTSTKQVDDIKSFTANRALPDKTIDKVVLLYSDGTFSSFSGQ